MNRYLLLIATLLLPSFVFASYTGSCGANLTWTLSDGNIFIVSGQGAMDDYSTNNVPWYSLRSSIVGIEIQEGVTTIGNNAFYSCANVKYVSLPTSLTSIGTLAFSHCKQLSEISLPGNLTRLGERCFQFCYLLRSVVIPASVRSISANPFARCFELCQLKVEEGNPNYYSGEYNAIIQSSTNKLVAGCSLTKIPETIEIIGSYAFSGCKGYSSSYIPASVISIEDYAFGYETGITTMTFPETVKSFGKGIFKQSSNLRSVTFPDNYSGSIPDYAFYQCPQLSSAKIGRQTKSTGLASFSGCDNLLTVDLGESLVTLGSETFYGCTSLTSVILPNTLQNLYSLAFSGCHGIKQMVLPASVTYVEQGSSLPSNLTNLTILSLIPPKTFFSTQKPFPNLEKICVLDGCAAAYSSGYWGRYPLEEISIPCAAPTLDLVDGNLQALCSTEGATFHYSLSLPPSFSTGSCAPLVVISVYASAPNHSVSPTITRAFSLIKGSRYGDYNGDFNLDVVDVTTLINSIMKE